MSPILRLRSRTCDDNTHGRSTWDTSWKLSHRLQRFRCDVEYGPGGDGRLNRRCVSRESVHLKSWDVTFQVQSSIECTNVMGRLSANCPQTCQPVKTGHDTVTEVNQDSNTTYEVVIELSLPESPASLARNPTVLAFPRRSRHGCAPPLLTQPCFEYDRHSDPFRHNSKHLGFRHSPSVTMYSLAHTINSASVAARNTSASALRQAAYRASCSAGQRAQPSTEM
jgi:hypothetical protein